MNMDLICCKSFQDQDCHAQAQKIFPQAGLMAG